MSRVRFQHQIQTALIVGFALSAHLFAQPLGAQTPEPSAVEKEAELIIKLLDEDPEVRLDSAKRLAAGPLVNPKAAEEALIEILLRAERPELSWTLVDALKRIRSDSPEFFRRLKYAAEKGSGSALGRINTIYLYAVLKPSEPESYAFLSKALKVSDPGERLAAAYAIRLIKIQEGISPGSPTLATAHTQELQELVDRLSDEVAQEIYSSSGDARKTAIELFDGMTLHGDRIDPKLVELVMDEATETETRSKLMEIVRRNKIQEGRLGQHQRVKQQQAIAAAIDGTLASFNEVPVFVSQVETPKKEGVIKDLLNWMKRQTGSHKKKCP